MNWLIILITSAQLLFSEQRVFKLRIVNTKTKKSHIVHTTLDWNQYIGYNHLSRDERIEVLDHWMCWKRSNGLKPLCQRPVTLDSLKSESQEPQG